jgi:hypothetical protein
VIATKEHRHTVGACLVGGIGQCLDPGDGFSEFLQSRIGVLVALQRCLGDIAEIDDIMT